MALHEFELVLTGGPDLETFTELMAEALWNPNEDLWPGISCGVRHVGVCREGSSLEQVALSVIDEVISKGLGSRVVLVRDLNGKTISTPAITDKIESQAQASGA